MADLPEQMVRNAWRQAEYSWFPPPPAADNDGDELDNTNAADNDDGELDNANAADNNESNMEEKDNASSSFAVFLDRQ